MCGPEVHVPHALAGPEGEREEVAVDGLAPDNYLEKFSWNEAKYPPRRPLNETVVAITETIQKLEDDLKVPTSASLPRSTSTRTCCENRG